MIQVKIRKKKMKCITKNDPQNKDNNITLRDLIGSVKERAYSEEDLDCFQINHKKIE
jgi:hypothetical protein